MANKRLWASIGESVKAILVIGMSNDGVGRERCPVRLSMGSHILGHRIMLESILGRWASEDAGEAGVIMTPC